MADALISPAVGGVMWAATAGLTAYSAKKVQTDLDERKVPLMGVLGAFIFAAQMINFSIPGTGSSGHLGGGLILAALLGPYAGFLTMASVLIIQALFFADGGLLALGCNMFNLGFYACFIAYPLIFRPLIKNQISSGRILAGSMIAAIVGLQLGAFSVVIETVTSGVSDLPFKTFVLFMQPIHLAIGIVEGLITAAVVGYVWKARPEILEKASAGQTFGAVSVRRVVIVLAGVAVLTGGVLSWFASTHPDGLEWSMVQTSGKDELKAADQIHQFLAGIQRKTAFLPGYSFKAADKPITEPKKESGAGWPAVNNGAVNGGTSVSGITGGFLTLLLAGVVGFILHYLKKYAKKST